MRKTIHAGEIKVTRRHALQLLGTGAAAGAAFVATGCGGSGKRTDDKSGGGFAKEQTTRGLNAARYADSGTVRFNSLPWGIDNRGVALLGGEITSAALAAEAAIPNSLFSDPLTQRLLFITPDGRQSPVSAATSAFFALARIGTALYTENDIYTENDVPALYLSRPDSSAGQLVLGVAAVPEATGFGLCDISDRGENVVVVALKGSRSHQSDNASFLLRGSVLPGGGDGGGNFSRVAEAVGYAFPPRPPDGSRGSEILRYFRSVAVNDAGEVAFLSERVDGSRALYFVPVGGGGGTPVLLAVTEGNNGGGSSGAVNADILRVVEITGGPSLNESGTVAFAVRRTDNRSAIVKWRRGVFTTVAVSEPEENYGPVSLNNAGGIAYTAIVGRGNAGPPLSRVAYLPSVAASVEDGITFIASGDRVFGRKVVTPFLGGPRGLNDRLEMAISYGRESQESTMEIYAARMVLSVSVQTL